MKNGEIRKLQTVSDLLDRLGVPADRVRLQPAPGTATIADVVRIHDAEGRLCELVDGTLVEKAMGLRESFLGVYLATLLMQFVRPRNLGVITGADGKVELVLDLVRIPDIAFIAWSRMPGGRLPVAPIPRLVPNLAVEVLSASNTPKEMSAKRDDYFNAGVELVWEVDPGVRTVDVYTSPTACTTLRVGDVLDGGAVLPGFQLPLADLFAELDRHG